MMEARAAEQLGTLHVGMGDLRPEIGGELIFLLFGKRWLVSVIQLLVPPVQWLSLVGPGQGLMEQ